MHLKYAEDATYTTWKITILYTFQTIKESHLETVIKL